MRKILYSLSIGLLVLLPVYSRAEVIQTFEGYGYEDRMLLGREAQSEYYFLLPPSFVPEQSDITLHLSLSEIIDSSQSFLTIRIEGDVFRTIALSDIEEGKLHIDLQELPTQGKGFRLELFTSVTLKEVFCQQRGKHHLAWIRVEGSSEIQFKQYKTAEYHTNSIYEMLYRVRSIMLYGHQRRAEVEAAIWLHAMKQLEQSRRLKLLVWDEKKPLPDGAMLASLWEDLPLDIREKKLQYAPQGDQGVIEILSWKDSTGKWCQGLFVSGRTEVGLRKAISALLHPIMATNLRDSFAIISRAKSPERWIAYEAGEPISLAQFFRTSSHSNGTGGYASEWAFLLSDFVDYPKEIKLHLEASYMPLDSPYKLYLNVYINEKLLHSKSLDHSGKVAIQTNIKYYELSKYNKLRMEFLVNGEGNKGCDVFDYYVDLRASYLQGEGFHRPSQLLFFDLPERFYHGNTQLVARPDIDIFDIEALSLLVQSLNRERYAATKSYPPLVWSDEVDRSEGNNLLAYLPADDELVQEMKYLPLRWQKTRRIYSSNNQDTLFFFSDSLGQSICQTFFGNKKEAVLLLNEISSEEKKMVSFDVLDKFIKRSYAQSTANVGVANSRGEIYFFNLNPIKKEVSYRLDRWEELWQRYSLFLWVVLLILSVGITIYLYQVSRRFMKNNMPDKYV